MASIVSAVIPQTGPFELRSVLLSSMDADSVADWQRLRFQNSLDQPLQDPEWIRGFFRRRLDNVVVHFLSRAGALVGFVPFVRKDWSLRWQFGELTLAKLPLKRLHLLGNSFAFPDDAEVYDSFFESIVETGGDFDALYLEGIPAESFLSTYLRSSRVFGERFRTYVLEQPSPRLMMRLGDSYEEYLKKFNSKHRATLRRKVRKLEEAAGGKLRMVRYTEPEDVGSFVDLATEVSRKTYQWNLLGGGLREPENLKTLLRYLAERGWLRSYLLFCNGAPCAFEMMFQHGKKAYLYDMGYDPEWRQHTPGTALTMLILEDLFQYNRPELVDMGDYGEHKEEFANESYLQSRMLLFRRGAYTRFVQAGHQLCGSTTKAASKLLDRMQWKNELKKKMRTWSGKS